MPDFFLILGKNKHTRQNKIIVPVSIVCSVEKESNRDKQRISWRIKSQVLDKCKVLSADTGHHSETDCTALECWLVFLCALSCTQENPRPALYQTSAQFDLNRMHARRRTLRPPDWGERRRRQRLKSPPVSELFRETSTD